MAHVTLRNGLSRCGGSSQFWEKGFAFPGLQDCALPPGGTPLSSHGFVARERTIDPSVYVVPCPRRRGRGKAADEYLLAWTTTPWTPPGNVALAVGADVDHVRAR